VTDPRFLDATYDDMFMDAWAAYFETARKAGQGDLIEDDDFDLDAILKDLETKADGDPPDDWEPAETWEVTPDDSPRT
jgi:hypothetical protein